jgi:type II secretory pathway component PulJ
MMQRTHGFTVVELLVAAVIMVAILGVVSALFSSSTRAYAVTATANERLALAEATKQMLGYDLGLAGYRGTSFTQFAANTFSEPTVAIVNAATSEGSDAITVRYFEDRYGAAGNAQTVVAYTHSGDSLLRKVNDTDAQVVARGIERLSAKFILLDPDPEASLGTTNPAIGITLTISFVGQPDVVVQTIAFKNTQTAALAGN